MLKSKNRLNFLEIEEVSGAAKPADTPRGVGYRLAQARESAGYSLDDVAGYLRVRRNYLEAIEAERYDALPGRTYAIGFVRAYAELVGLDAPRLVNEFKAETAALKSRTELVFPSPPPEGRIPGGAILFVSVLVALLAYGGWYYISVTEKGVAELVPAVPDRLVALLEGGRAADTAGAPAAVEEPSARQAVAAITRDEEPPLPAPAASALPAPAVTAPVVSEPAPAVPVSAVPPAPVTAPAPSTATVVPVAPRQAAPAPAQATPSQPVPQAATDIVSAPQAPSGNSTSDPIASAPTPSAEEERTPEPSSLSGAPAASGPALAARDTASNDTATSGDRPAASASTAPAAQAPTPTPAPTPAAPQTVASLPATGSAGSSGGTGSDTSPTVGPRIVLNATDEVWLQIREGENALVTRILRKGDTYRVPNRSGLTLLTGNAGALEILVDGKPAPTLGPLGAVRRDVALDPQALLSGADARQ
ncbi:MULTISPECIES: helix-turn-helix domain-containing protein [Oceanibaculum]|uniref:Cytoskeletal protein RodZ n=1 Tax=Oceanibaculum indicum TaxID=526216 RepID=A0A420WFZ6_9PROT|nr:MULTISPECIES: helix-turn-helix domain-containing protein [Oceanibaculum]MCH2394149.1 helix-turn-helix domain-containing protein [Oceanibaculum sp.]RKQ69889.1 cytoskeletal protein RodZ [Oceanibaculum indicum]